MADTQQPTVENSNAVVQNGNGGGSATPPATQAPPMEDMPEDYDPDGEAVLDKIPWAQVPVTNTLPELLFNFEIKRVYPGRTQADASANPPKQAKRKVVMELVIHGPDEFAGRMHTENFVIGTDNDPDAANASLWLSGGSFAATNMARVMQFTQCNDDWRQLIGKRFAAFVQHSEGSRPGQKYSNIVYTMLYKWGEMAAGSATPVNPNTRKGRMRSPGAQPNGVAAASSTGTVQCPNCKGDFGQSAILEHIKQCRG